jgi:hypothetical protein
VTEPTVPGSSVPGTGVTEPAARTTVEPLRGFPYAPALSEQPGDDAAAGLLRYLGRDPRWTG